MATSSHLLIMKGDVPEDKANMGDGDEGPGSLVSSLSPDAVMFKDLQFCELCLYQAGNGTQMLGIIT